MKIDFVSLGIGICLSLSGIWCMYNFKKGYGSTGSYPFDRIMKLPKKEHRIMLLFTMLLFLSLGLLEIFSAFIK